MASREEALEWAANTAIKVVDGTVEVVSEGHWKPYPQCGSNPTGY